MGHNAIEIEPLTPRIGAEIRGIDLADLDDASFEAAHAALMRHQVVFFRDQVLTVEQHKAVGRRFGELHIHPSSPPPDGHPEILIVHADENAKRIAGERWHSDVSCDPEPPMGSVLYLWSVPEHGGGDTLFASQYAAYEALSEPLKDLLDPMTATHSGDHVYRGRYKDRGVDDWDKVYPEAVHPVVRTHPVTGRKSLYVNSTFTTRINELNPGESDALLAFLCAHSTQAQFQCRFRWEAGSVAFWDNRCVQHMAMWDYYPEVRSGHRVTIKGDRPV